MRFEQLKRKSNVVLKKKLYKSGKNWVVAASLTIAGGIMFSTFSTTVKADDIVDSTTDGEQVENTQATSNSEKSEDTENQVPDESQNITLLRKNESEVVTPAADQQTEKTVESATPPAIQNTSETVQEVEPSANNSVLNSETDINGSDIIFSSAKDGKFAEGTDNTGQVSYSGSDWYLNKAGELHIESGNWKSLGPDDPKFSDKYANDITKVIFDGDVTAGDSIYELFWNLPHLTEVENLEKLNTSNTKNFSFMFFKDGNLTSFDLNKLTWTNVENVESMFASTGLTNVDMRNFNAPKITNYGGMFNGTKNLIKADLTNMSVGPVSKEENAIYLFEMFLDSSVQDIVLDGIHPMNENNYFNFGQMLMGCENLKTVDLSPLKSFPKGTSTSFSGMLNFNEINPFYGKTSGEPEAKIEKIIVSKENDFSRAVFTYNSGIYSGWISNPLPSDKTLADLMSADGTGLVNPYNEHFIDEEGNILEGISLDSIPGDANGNITWTPVKRKELQSTIRYWTQDQDQSKDKPIKITAPFTSYEGASIDIPTIEGYALTTPTTFTVKSSGPIDVIVKKLEPYNLEINVNYGDDPSKNNSVIVTLIGGSKNVIKDNNFQNDLNKVPNATNNTLDLSKLRFNFSGLIDDVTDPFTLDDLEQSGIKISDKTNLKSIIDDVLQGLLAEGTNFKELDQAQSSVPFVEVYYDKYVASALPKPENHHTSSSSSLNSSSVQDSKNIKNITQTSSTFASEIKVALYDNQGKKISNLFLSPDSSWYNDQLMELDGITYYRVATDQWVNAKDVYVYKAHNIKVMVYHDKFGQLVSASGKVISDRELSPVSAWFSDRFTEINGRKYYRVATNEFVSVDQVYEYVPVNQVVFTKELTNIYDEKGQLTSQQLPTNSLYMSDLYQIIDGITYYRVATNQFVKAEDIKL